MDGFYWSHVLKHPDQVTRQLCTTSTVYPQHREGTRHPQCDGFEKPERDLELERGLKPSLKLQKDAFWIFRWIQKNGHCDAMYQRCQDAAF